MPSICVIGGGPAGICAGVKITTDLQKDKEFTIFESHDDFGGSWFSHTYPNCEADVPSHIYSYSFVQKSDWTSVYAKQSEMRAYLQDVALKYDLYSHTKFNHTVCKMEWEKESRWKVTALNKKTENMQEYYFDFVIFAVGYFLLPKFPKVFQSFEGKLVHSAEWDHSLQLNDKVVSVIGSGPSAVQVIPGIVKDVKKLYSFQRRAAFVIPKPQFDISSTTKAILNKFPLLITIIRAFLFLLFESVLFVITKNSWRNSLATSIAKRFNRGNNLSSHKLTQLKPSYPFGTTQPAFSSEYFSALAHPHVEVITDEIAKIEGNSIFTTDGQERTVDIVILTTGYYQTYQQRGKNYTIHITVGGKDVSRNVWGKPDNYLSLMKEQVPNVFLLGGPNSGLVHHSHFFAVECGMNWVTKVLKEMRNQSRNKVELKDGVQKEYMTRLEKEKQKWVMIPDPEENTQDDDDDSDGELKRENAAGSILCPWGAVGFWKKLRKLELQHLQFS